MAFWKIVVLYRSCEKQKARNSGIARIEQSAAHWHKEFIGRVLLVVVDGGWLEGVLLSARINFKECAVSEYRRGQQNCQRTW
jgi:flagellar motor component MotA